MRLELRLERVVVGASSSHAKGNYGGPKGSVLYIWFCPLGTLETRCLTRYILWMALPCAFSNDVRNLAVNFDQNMFFKMHIKQIYLTAF